MPQEKFMNKYLLNCKKFKQKLYRQKLNFPTVENQSRYRYYRNEYFRSIRRAKRIYYQNQISQAGGDSRKLWSTLREALGVKQSRKEMEYLEIEGSQITDRVEIANHFNGFFSSLGTNLTPNIPSTTRDFREYLPPRIEDSVFIPPLDEYKTFELITNCKPKLSQDNNDVSMNLLIRCAAPLSVPLCYIYNLSINLGVFPNLMKTSKSVIIYKSGPISLMDSYRGVSMIDSFSKPLERHMYSCIYDFLDAHSFFSSRQFGFRKGHSTSHNILDLMNLVTETFMEGKVCSIVLLDIKKAFDLVDRDILLYKLQHYGCRGTVLTWFKTYYQGRNQRVYFRGGFSSTIEEIVIGLIQGSCLGVLTFLVFINDLEASALEALFNLFCDDTLIFLKSDSFQNLVSKLNEILPQVNDWYKANKMIINSLKTKVVLFQTPRQQLTQNDKDLIKNFPVFINNNNENEHLPEKIVKLNLTGSHNPEDKDQSARHLGVQIDDKLNFKAHFNLLHKRLMRAVFSLRIMKHLLDLKHLKMLYSSYIKSIIEYSILIFSAVPNSTIAPIKKIQKECVRLITNKPRTAPSAPLFKQLQILPFKELMDFNIAQFMFRFKHGLCPKVFDNQWNYRFSLHSYNTRQRRDFTVDASTRSYIQNSPLNYFPRFFNSLPEYLKRIDDFKEFKRKTFIFLLNRIQ